MAEEILARMGIEYPQYGWIDYIDLSELTEDWEWLPDEDGEYSRAGWEACCRCHVHACIFVGKQILEVIGKQMPEDALAHA